MKKILLFIFLLNCHLHIIYAQNNYSGRYFVATAMKGKGFPCNRVTYCVLKFSKDSVEVSYPSKAYCNTGELSKENSSYNEKLTKNYKWGIANEHLTIPQFKKYNEYKFEEKDENFIKDLYPNAIIPDTLVYHKYIGGKPSLLIIDVERKIAKKWGIVMEYITGDCTQKYDYKEKECEIKNKRLYEYMNRQYGENWKAEFDKQVLEEIKLKSNKG